MNDINPRDIKSVKAKVPEFESVRITVNPASDQNGRFLFHTVGIMDDDKGVGTRADLRYVEAEATAVLKAIRKYRRQNPQAFD